MADLKTCNDGKFTNEQSGYSVVFNDDGRVAYAYLLNQEGSIVSDVWLYNRCESPREPEWHNPNNMPFANPVAYSKDHNDFSGVNSISDVSIDWPTGEVVEARVIIYGKLFAILLEGSKPGWCCMAKKNGPLAKILEN